MKAANIFLLFILLSSGGFSNTYTVVNTNDAGSGSLRDAITSANTHPGSDIVAFNIPVSDAGYNATNGTWTITVAIYLPYITGSGTIIDGTTQTAAQGDKNPLGPEILLTGTNNSINHGFCLMNVANCVIKGITINRFIDGIQIFGAASKNNIISGNYLGTNFDASDSAGNNIGIEIIGGAKLNTIGGVAAADRNIASGNRHIGIRLVNADSNNVFGNFVGTDRTGTIAIPNFDGISIEGTAKANNIGGTTAGKRNIVSGNFAYGVPIIGTSAKYNKVCGNFIGTDVAGTAAIPNTYGVLFDDGSSWNFVGGDSAAHRNIISGNSGYGVFVYNFGTNNNEVKGNYIGTDKNGTIAIPNGNGIVIDAGAIKNRIENNLISGNAQQGINIHGTYTDSNTVTGNYIGTDFSGAAPLGNAIDGIRIAEGAKHNLIGGTANNKNIIAFNSGAGVFLMTPGDLYNKISCNNIYGNTGLGIDLFPPGINQNDANDTDTGPNFLMNFPVITSADYWTYNNLTHINGTIDTQNPQSATVEIFIADADSISYGQGKTYVGCATPDASGNWSVQLAGINAGDIITSTATDALGNTSEFSLNKFTGLYTGIDEKVSNAAISVFPIPANSSITFNVGLNTEWEEIRISDITGRIVYEGNISGQTTVNIDVSGVPAGIYVAEIIGTHERLNKRIVIVR